MTLDLGQNRTISDVRIRWGARENGAQLQMYAGNQWVTIAADVGKTDKPGWRTVPLPSPQRARQFRVSMPNTAVDGVHEIYEIELLGAGENDLAYGKPVKSSGSSGQVGQDSSTADERLRVDLGAGTAIDSVSATWAGWFPKQYKVQVSNAENGPWTDVATENLSSVGTRTSTFSPVSTRYLRIFRVTSENPDQPLKLVNVSAFGPGTPTSFALASTPSDYCFFKLAVDSASDWSTVESGASHQCAIKTNKKLYCRGSDANGQLGNGPSAGSADVPQRVTSAADWSSVSAGGSHTCAILVTYTKLYCWGSDSSGQLGNGTPTGDVQSASSISQGWSSVSAGKSHTCGTKSGYLWCWGSDATGALGDGTTTTANVTSPKQIGTGNTWSAVSSGDSHTCGIQGGKAFCWGADTSGQIGNGTASSAMVAAPVQITSATTWTSLTAGEAHTCGIAAGLLYCWGSDANGQLGNGSSTANVAAPVRIGSATNWKAVSAGKTHTCATNTSDELWCWGTDENGKLMNVPTKMSSDTGWKSVSAGSNTACAIRSGKLYC